MKDVMAPARAEARRRPSLPTDHVCPDDGKPLCADDSFERKADSCAWNQRLEPIRKPVGH